MKPIEARSLIGIVNRAAMFPENSVPLGEVMNVSAALKAVEGVANGQLVMIPQERLDALLAAAAPAAGASNGAAEPAPQPAPHLGNGAAPIEPAP